jgi:L-asparagine transporter-like permease
MHDTVDAIIRSVFMYAAQEANDDGSLRHVVRSLADLRDHVAESQSRYVQAYSSLNFVFVLIDRHFVWVMGVKAFKAVLVYMGVMMAQRGVLDYHDAHPELEKSKKFYFTMFPLYLSIILLFIDISIVVLMFFVGKVIGFFSSSTFLSI